MAVRAIIGFDHLPQNDVTWINYASHGITRDTGNAAQNVISGGWLVSKSTAAGNERVTIPLTPYLASPVGKIWVSFRFRITKNVNGGAGIVYFNTSYLLIINDIPGMTIGQTYHAEFGFDLSTGAVERWIDGVKLSNSSNSPGAGTRTMTLGLEAKGSVANNVDWREIVVVDDQGSALGQPIGPLGKGYTLAPITLDAATGSEWTVNPAGTSLLTALSDPGSVPTAAIAISPASKQALVAGLKPNLQTGFNVAALELTAGATSTTASSATNTTKLKAGSNELAGANVLAPASSVYSYNNSLGVFHKAPDGNAWSNAALDATDIVLTPDQ